MLAIFLLSEHWHGDIHQELLNNEVILPNDRKQSKHNIQVKTRENFAQCQAKRMNETGFNNLRSEYLYQSSA
jgi:hypothetical protein